MGTTVPTLKYGWCPPTRRHGSCTARGRRAGATSEAPATDQYARQPHPDRWVAVAPRAHCPGWQVGRPRRGRGHVRRSVVGEAGALRRVCARVALLRKTAGERAVIAVLYVVGVDVATVFAGVRTGGTPTHWVSGFRSTTGRNRYKSSGSAVPPGIKVCSAQQRRRTPPLFADWLIELAQLAQLGRAAC